MVILKSVSLAQSHHPSNKAYRHNILVHYVCVLLIGSFPKKS